MLFFHLNLSFFGSYHKINLRINGKVKITYRQPLVAMQNSTQNKVLQTLKRRSIYA